MKTFLTTGGCRGSENIKCSRERDKRQRNNYVSIVCKYSKNGKKNKLSLAPIYAHTYSFPLGTGEHVDIILHVSEPKTEHVDWTTSFSFQI